MTYRIGWETFDGTAIIKAGSSGTQRVIMTVDDGEEPPGPVPTYDGWTASVVFTSPYTGQPAITFNPTVVGNAGAMTLTMDLEFEPDDTASLRPGDYECNAVLIQPATDDHWLPFGSYVLTIEGSS